MTTFNRALTGRSVSAGEDRASLDDRRVARPAFVRDTVRTIYDADIGIDPADLGSLAGLADAAELEHISHDVSQRSVVTPPTSTGDRMRKHHSAIGGVALALTLTLTGCSDDGTDPDAQDTPTATVSTPATSAPPAPKTPEEKAAAALTSYLDVRDDALRAATIDFKRLNKVATGREFLNIQQNVGALKSSGTKVTGEYVHTLDEPRGRTDTTFIITDCEDRSGVERRRQGNAVPPPDDPEGNPLGNPIPIDYEVVMEKGRWLVSNSDVQWDEKC